MKIADFHSPALNLGPNLVKNCAISKLRENKLIITIIRKRKRTSKFSHCFLNNVAHSSTGSVLSKVSNDISRNFT